MRKQFLLKHLFLVVPIMLFLHSCKKDNVPEVTKDQNSTQSLVDIAKSSLEKQSLAGSPLLSNLKSIGMAPDWSNIKTSINSENKTVLAIPLEQTANSFSELNVIVTNGLPHEVIKKYTVSNDNSILLEFYALNGRLLKAGQYDATSGKFQLAKSITNSVILYEQKNKLGSNGNLFLLLANNKTKISTGVKTVAVNGIHDLEEVEIEGQGPATPEIGDPQGPSNDNGYGPVDYYPVEPVPPSGGSAGGEDSDPSANFVNKIDDTKLKDCFKKVLENLKNIDRACLPNLVKVFSGNTPGYNWIMQDGNTSVNNGVTNASYNRTTASATTTFNSDNFKGGSDLAIAKTILHESVHAYLVAYFGVDNISAQQTYSQYFEAYNKSTRPDLNDLQHNEMVRNFIGSVAGNLISYGKNQGYNLPDQFYYDLSWGGLQETSAFKNLTPDVQKRILNVIKIEQSGIDVDGNQSKPKGNTSGGC
ncbi:hypothetical protein AY601_4065 [Pedobacter cryoconitis]|uniref:Uncharacterized protein n=1 Tax=Pedobacter cryoconitis TaxID=188932 RepID=A0A127VHW3_9SPHI|nr:hypothetical protein [Pedobacter cryoconitis]AMQ00916.1 hypothetical protein AY601_4065 [Pedobacter cryoconitis]